jgi:hypothetical protein
MHIVQQTLSTSNSICDLDHKVNSSPVLTIGWSGNRNIVDKTHPDRLSSETAWTWERGTPSELAAHIGMGHPWMPARLDKGARRWQSKSNYAEVLSLDIDNGLSIAGCLAIGFVQQHLTIGIESASSCIVSEKNPDGHEKFRLVFALTAPLISHANIRLCNEYLAHVVGHADPAAKDASRYYFGASGKKAFLLTDNTLPDDFLEQAIGWGVERDRQIEAEAERAAALWAKERESMSLDDQLERVKEALDCTPPYSPGHGTRHHYVRICGAVLRELGSDGRALLMGAPLARGRHIGGFDKFLRSVERSRPTGRAATLGSLFHWAKEHGYRPPSRDKSHALTSGNAGLRAVPRVAIDPALGQVIEPAKWGDGPPEFRTPGWMSSDDKQVSEEKKRNRQIAKRKLDLEQHWPQLRHDYELTELTLEAPGTTVIRYSGYCPALPPLVGTVAIQGGLGSGKTEALIQALKPDWNVVWLAPRNGLLRGTAARAEKAGLVSYHYQDDVQLHRHMLRTRQPGMFMMAPDSLKAYSTGNQTGDGIDWSRTLVVVDEFASIRSEILGKTASLPEFERLLSTAGGVVVADAFLSDTDLQILQGYRPESPLTVLIQDSKPAPKTVELLESKTSAGITSLKPEGQALAQIYEWIAQGIRRIAIATDNKNAAKVMRDYVRCKGLNAVVTCSETIEANKDLLPDPDAFYKRHGIEVAIITPTLESGGDIQTNFERGLLMSSGVVSPKSALQLMGRFRQVNTWAVVAAHVTHKAPTITSIDSATARAGSIPLAGLLVNDLIPAGGIRDLWAARQDATKDVETSYSREILERMLRTNFERVETRFISLSKIADEANGDAATSWVSEWRARSHGVKVARLTELLKEGLQGLAHGQQLTQSKKTPQTDRDQRCLELAGFHSDFPRFVEKTLEEFNTRFSSEDAEKLALVFYSSRAKRLRNWVSLTEFYARELNVLEAKLPNNPAINRCSDTFKKYKYLKLAHGLGLAETLVKGVRRNKNIAPDVTHFWANSVTVCGLYQQFQDGDLWMDFPEIENRKGFWALCKKVLAWLGFQTGECGNASVEVPQPVKNGLDRRGEQRYSRVASCHHTSWVRHEDSGSAFFRDVAWAELHSDLITQVSRAITQEERSLPPPVPGYAPPLLVAA